MIIHNICDKLFILFIGKFILRRKLMGRTMKSVFISLILLMMFTCNVEAASIRLSRKKLSIKVGQTVTLKVRGAKKKKVKWKLTNKNIVKLNNKGKITGIKVGKTTVIARIGKKSLRCQVSVRKIASKMTAAQRYAIESAKSYLSFMAFSKEGLKSQLRYEKYSEKDAQYAVDHCGADWYEQAYKCAKGYMEDNSLSRSELIDQLIYEGYSPEQAIYGVNRVLWCE